MIDLPLVYRGVSSSIQYFIHPLSLRDHPAFIGRRSNPTPQCHSHKSVNQGEGEIVDVITLIGSGEVDPSHGLVTPHSDLFSPIDM